MRGFRVVLEIVVDGKPEAAVWVGSGEEKDDGEEIVLEDVAVDKLSTGVMDEEGTYFKDCWAANGKSPLGRKGCLRCR